MSGGSYNYLCDSGDLLELLGKKDELESMRVALSALGYAEDAALETQELLDLIGEWEETVELRINKLRKVWESVEWYHSSDRSEEDVREELVRYRSAKK